MKLELLINRLVNVAKEYGGELEVDVITETDETGQVEQKLGDVAVSIRQRRVKLVPESF